MFSESHRNSSFGSDPIHIGGRHNHPPLTSHPTHHPSPAQPCPAHSAPLLTPHHITPTPSHPTLPNMSPTVSECVSQHDPNITPKVFQQLSLRCCGPLQEIGPEVAPWLPSLCRSWMEGLGRSKRSQRVGWGGEQEVLPLVGDRL